MMSQMEIWKMQDYCESRNTHRSASRGGKRTYSSWNIAFMLLGLILMTLSGCLMAFLVMHIEEGMGMGFFAVCGIGIAAGAAMTVISRFNL